MREVYHYPDEYAPECLGCMSEFSHEDNPEYLQNLITESRASKEFDAVELITLEVSGAAIDDVLLPPQRTISAKIVSP